ncbi:MAG TPA: hypothetical protein VHP11_08580 [Tepidisphaeraceae bacterium]|nr:hypothetical protein [Tepidisphaeraceae bacterium]
MSPAKKHKIIGLLLLGLLVGIPAANVGSYWWDWMHRPMFYNVFRGNDRTLLPFWQAVPPPQTDRFGNLFYIDWELNLFVVIATGDPYSYPEEPLMDGGRAVIPNRKLGRNFVVPKQANALLLFSRNGKLQTCALSPGEAGRLWAKDFADSTYPTDPFIELQTQYVANPSP